MKQKEGRGKTKRKNLMEKHERETWEAAPWYDEAILDLHVSWGQTKHYLTINVSAQKMKRWDFLYSYLVT